MFKFLAAAAIAFATVLPAAAQDKRVALVIGNSEYRDVSTLKNPVNDAADMGAALSRIGFAVTTLDNATAEQTRRALATFGERSKAADVAFVFYAGHAIQADGVNWLMPVDGKAKTLADVTSQSISLDQVTEILADVGQLAIVIVDAARDNPFADAKKRPPAKPSSPQKEARGPQNLLVGLAAAPGRRPLQGAGRNSPYTTALLRHLETPGLDLQKLMRNVVADVAKDTKGQQIPWFHATLPNDPVHLMQPR
jgi:uncharacterized caspase-like protein